MAASRRARSPSNRVTVGELSARASASRRCTSRSAASVSGQVLVVGRVHRRLEERGCPSPLAPLQQRRSARNAAACFRASADSSSPWRVASARSSELPRFARWTSRASSPRRHAARTPRRSRAAARCRPRACQAVARTRSDVLDRYDAARSRRVGASGCAIRNARRPATSQANAVSSDAPASIRWATLIASATSRRATRAPCSRAIRTASSPRTTQKSRRWRRKRTSALVALSSDRSAAPLASRARARRSSRSARRASSSPPRSRRDDTSCSASSTSPAARRASLRS